jgi:AcrR family transcriptional regulator
VSTSVRKPRGEYAKTAARRQEIVAAAVAVFSVSGFRDGSVRDVAERAGLTHAGVMHHFPTKVDLLQAVLEWYDEQSTQVVVDGLERGQDPLSALVALVEHNQQNAAIVGMYVQLSAEATSPDHPVHDYFTQRYAGAVALFRAHLDNAVRLGHMRADVDTLGTARRLLSLMDGLQVQWLYDPEAVDMAAEIRAYLEPMMAAAE